MAVYTGTEHFYRKEVEIKMYHKIQNKFALLRKQGNNTVVDYSR